MAEQFLYHFTPGPRPELATDPGAWSEADERVAERHFAYLREATDAGTVVMAGRCQDGVGPAIVIIETASEEAARAFMLEDPFVRNGLFGASLHPFRVALSRD